MKIAVISDLHLGTGDKTDQFRHDDFEFIKFLQFLERNFEKIVLLGDIYETLMPTIFGKTKDKIQSCINAHKEINNIFNKKQYIYIHGNHDIIASKYLKAPEQYVITDNKQKILFQHGHQYDSLIKTSRFVSELGVYLGGWLLRLGLLPIYKFISKIDPSNNISTSKQFNSMQENSSDIIVTGHTHVAQKIEYKDKLYINSGTCSNGKYNYIAIDTQKGTYDICYSW